MRRGASLRLPGQSDGVRNTMKLRLLHQLANKVPFHIDQEYALSIIIRVDGAEYGDIFAVRAVYRIIKTLGRIQLPIGEESIALAYRSISIMNLQIIFSNFTRSR